MTELYYGVSLPTEYSSSGKVHSVSDPYSLNPDPDKNLNPDPVPDPAPDPAPDPRYFLTLSEIFFPHNFLVFHMSIWIRIQGGKN